MMGGMVPERAQDSLARRLTRSELNRLAARRRCHRVLEGRILIYRDHIPYGAMLVVAGSVDLEWGGGMRHARSIKLFAPVVIGEEHLRQRRAFPLTVRAGAGVRACHLD